MSKSSKSVEQPIITTETFHKIRVIETEGEDKTTRKMGFVEFRKPGESLSQKKRMVTFDEEVMDELLGVNRGEQVEVEVRIGDGSQDPVVLDAAAV